MAISSAGAHQQTQVLQQVLVNHIDFGMEIQDAVDEDDLGKRGHRVIMGATQFGGCNLVMVDPISGVRLGAADPRRSGAALGY